MLFIVLVGALDSFVQLNINLLWTTTENLLHTNIEASACVKGPLNTLLEIIYQQEVTVGN